VNIIELERWKPSETDPRKLEYAGQPTAQGVYLDVYLKWYEDGKPITNSFITGKTLGENGNDLDRMFLISSAITKAFHWSEIQTEMEQVGSPIEAQRSGFDGERSRSGMSELSPQAEANDMELTATMGGQTFG